MVPEPAQRYLVWTPRLCALLCFALYAWMAPAGVYWLDSGELSAAAVQLGSPHPSGFPLYMIMAKVAAFVPIGELAYRINLLSSLCAALAVLWVARIVLEATERSWESLFGATAAAMTLAFSLTYFRQATVAEVYAPTAAALALTVWLFARVARGGGARTGLSLALVLGCGAALHAGYRLLVPLPIALLFWIRLRRGARWPLVTPVLCFFPFSALYAYLAVRSAQAGTALVDWGHPSHFDALAAHFRGQEILSVAGHRILSTHSQVWSSDVSSFLSTMAADLGPVPVLAAIYGLWKLARDGRNAWLSAMLLLIVVGDFTFSVWLHPMGIGELQNGVPFSLALCTSAGIGVSVFARQLSPKGAWSIMGPSLAGLMATLMIVPVVWVAFPTVARTRTPDTAGLWGEHYLDAATPRGVVVPNSDAGSSTTLYSTVVEHARPDVALLVRYPADPVRDGHALKAIGAPRGTVHELLEAGYAVYWEGQKLPAGLGTNSAWPLGRLRRGPSHLAGAASDIERFFARAGASDALAGREYAQAMSNLAVGLMDGARGVDAAQRAQWLAQAEALLKRGLKRAPRHARSLTNLGVAASLQRDFSRALAYTERAIAIAPNYVPARINAARYHLHLNHDEHARRHAAHAVSLAKDNADALTLWAVASARLGSPKKARELAERALAVEPKHRDANRLVEQLSR